MRKLLIGSVTAAALGGALAAASSVSAEQKRYEVAGFDSVSQVGPNNVVIQVGPTASVRAEGSQEALDLMKVVVENGELKILPKRERRDWGHGEDWDNVEPATFYITLPRLEAAAMVGSGDMTVDRIAGDRFSASVAGSAKVDIASLSAADVSLSVAGSGEVNAHGAVDRLQVSVAGSGKVQAHELASNSASVSIAGSGNVDLTVKDTARVSTVGSGDVAIAGGALCTVSSFGSGQTRCNGAVVEADYGPGRWGMWTPPAPPAPPAPPWNWGAWGKWRGWDGWHDDWKQRDGD